jgi:hypothetical protein
MIPKECLIDRCDEGVRGLQKSNRHNVFLTQILIRGAWTCAVQRQQPPPMLSALSCADLSCLRLLSRQVQRARVSESKTAQLAPTRVNKVDLTFPVARFRRPNQRTGVARQDSLPKSRSPYVEMRHPHLACTNAVIKALGESATERLEPRWDDKLPGIDKQRPRYARRKDLHQMVVGGLGGADC